MKKKFFCVALTLVICMTVFSPTFAAETKQALGKCFFSSSGRNVTFSGYSSSIKIEDVISVRVTLWEKRDSTWYAIDGAYERLEKAKFVSAGDSMTVDGGHYYKVTATHYSKLNGVSYSIKTETASKWIG
ncbi:MAG: hypothetical protein Q4C04_03330 [Clostridia bacterium]|nr:hypothetical protein [Clostridia bacterium]